MVTINGVEFADEDREPDYMTKCCSAGTTWADGTVGICKECGQYAPLWD